MSNEWLTAKLEGYAPLDPIEQQFKLKTLDLVKNTNEPFERTQFHPGHIVGSAIIINQTHDKILLILHKKLQRWLQPGGHSDGNQITLEVAAREAKEETGLTKITPVSTRIFDLDIHPYPERGEEPLHQHFDIRFLFQANEQEKLHQQETEIDGIKWVELSELAKNGDPFLIRAINKLIKLNQKPK